MAFVPREVFYASDNLQPSNLGSNVKAWGEALDKQDAEFRLPGFPKNPKKVFQCYIENFNFQLWKQRDGYIWQQWLSGRPPVQLEKFNLYKVDRRGS